VTEARVFLIGAGPGDPELLTVKAVRLLGDADVVVYDRLVAPEILDFVPAGASRIYVGKAPGNHPLPQEEINDLLVTLARSGRTVARLKGGDPFVFGRGSEEAAHLAANGIPFEVVPGITAASGCAAAAGMPLTHRGLATGVRFVTGHCRDGGALDWDCLADPDTTLVIYMGLSRMQSIAESLIGAGLAPSTPAAAVSAGTTPRQKVCRTTLENISSHVGRLGLAPPVLVYIGRVVEMMDVLTDRSCELGETAVRQSESRHA
jgi:uroporphyrin-III C-methyltransferase/precorrin-2 dehydrogenase/sirohydrochlorin ferrochelatase/uroporphyrin-III C-methyltransferase